MSVSGGPGAIELTKGAFVQAGRAAWAMTPIFVSIFACFALLALWQAALTGGRPRTVDASSVIVSLAIMVASSGFTALLAVVVHRYVLLHEVVGFSGLGRLAPVLSSSRR